MLPFQAALFSSVMSIMMTAFYSCHFSQKQLQSLLMFWICGTHHIVQVSTFEAKSPYPPTRPAGMQVPRLNAEQQQNSMPLPSNSTACSACRYWLAHWLQYAWTALLTQLCYILVITQHCSRSKLLKTSTQAVDRGGKIDILHSQTISLLRKHIGRIPGCWRW